MTKEQVVFWLLLLRFNPDNNVLPNEVIDISIGAVLANPERGKGEWIDGKCNRCGEREPPYGSNFCPHCGVDMRKETKDVPLSVELTKRILKDGCFTDVK